MVKKLDLIWPSEILLEEFMKPLGISQNRLARDIDVPPARINDIVHGRRAITADTALRLGKYFGTSAELWMGLQMDYDLRRASVTCGRRWKLGSARSKLPERVRSSVPPKPPRSPLVESADSQRLRPLESGSTLGPYRRW